MKSYIERVKVLLVPGTSKKNCQSSTSTYFSYTQFKRTTTYKYLLVHTTVKCDEVKNDDDADATCTKKNFGQQAVGVETKT